MIAKLYRYGFKAAGQIIYDLGKLKVHIQSEEFCNKVPQVYAWVKNKTVLYIGKAGKGTKKRHIEHIRGWHGGSATGIKNAKQLKLLLQNNQTIEIFALTCETFTQDRIRFEKKITEQFSWMDRDEQELIAIFKPPLNVNGKGNKNGK